jgi:hypothetical protein
LPPATRVRFFAKHLPQFGWRPIVLTTKPEYYEWPVDEENDRLLPDRLEVIRTKALPPRWTRKVGIGDLGLRTLWHHWQAIKLLCREREIDLIFIPVPPSVPMVLGRMAYGKFGIPYVIDYIDPWVTGSYKNVPRKQRPPKWRFAYALARMLEPYALKHVGHITGVSKGTTDSVIQRYKWLNEGDATEIPYGGEADDFEYLRQQPRGNPIFDRADGLMHMSCVGACIPAMHATVRALFQAFRLGLEEFPQRFCRLRLHFVGTSYAPTKNGPEEIAKLAREAGIADYVEEHRIRIPYLESLQVMLDSDALFLVGSDASHYTASKVFPYILARRSLLAIFNEQSSVAQILRETGAGEVITFGPKQDPSEKVMEIKEQLDRFTTKSESYRPQTRWHDFEKYTTSAMSSRLADCLNAAINS